MMWMSGLLLLISSAFVVHCSELKVVNLRNGRLNTYLSIVKFEGTTYEKRYRNASTDTNVPFQVDSSTDLTVDLSVSWLLDGKPLEVPRLDFTGGKDAPNIFSSEHYNEGQKMALIVLYLRDAGVVPGNYTITVTQGSNTVSASGLVVSAPILPYFQKPKRVLEGDLFHMVCTPEGYPRLTNVTWLFSPIPTSQMEDDGVLATAIKNLQPLELNSSRFSEKVSPGGSILDTLVLSDLRLPDNGVYACNATNSEGSDISLIVINVKDRWAAMWPFIGIVVEVAILVAAILLYERHQMRSKPAATASTEVPAASNQQSGKPDSAVGGTDYPPATGNKLVTAIQSSNAEEAKAAGQGVVDAADGRNYDDQKQEELRLRGGTTKC